MNDSTVHNLVSGSADGTGWVGYGNVTVQTGNPISATTSDASPDNLNAILTSPLSVTSGTPYTLTAEVKATPNCYVASTGMVSLTKGILAVRGFGSDIFTEWTHISATLTPSGTASNAMVAFLVASKDGSPASLYVRNLMLVKGTSPAAWAPADGETLAGGGGAQMSANLWNAATANKKPDADGVYLCGKSTGALFSNTTGASAFTENQTIHMGASLRGAGKGCLKPYVAYTDAAGNWNWVGFQDWTPTDQWQRFEGSCVVPSGMTPMSFGFNKSHATGDIEVLNPVFSYGSPVTLAMAQASAANVDDGKSPTVSVSKSGTVTTITVHNADGSTTTQKVNDGTNGTPGAKGADGKTTYLHVKYSNDNGATFTSNSGETVGTYIGTCTDFNQADPTTVSSYKWARIKGDTGAKGDPGAKGETGATGVGVKSSTVTYQSSSSGTTIPTGTWSSGIPSVPEGSFLWTRIVYSYSNGTSTTAYSVGKMGAKGDKGATGNTGAPGAAGRGIKSSNVTYQAGNSQTTVPTGSWATSVPKLSSATPYLWTRTILTYTDNTTSTAYSVGTTLDGVNVGGRNLLRGTDYEINTYTTKTTDTGNFGSGFNFGKYVGDHGSDYEAFVPYGYSYRASVDVLIPVDGNIVIDINNYAPEGEDSWNDNDNDNGSYRTSTHFSVKANIWTRISWGSENTASGNTKKLPIRVLDSVGLLAQSKDITWSYRGLKVELGNTATDWSPAPEDVATDIADAANTATNALEKANNNEKNITEATKAILDIQENIKALVTGPNGSSLMTQTNKGWTFDMSSIERTLNEATDDITNLNSDLSATNNILNSTKKLLDDVTKKTAYINFATDDSGNPCIELGKQDNPFKLRITNTSIDFMQGSQKIAYLTNHQLYIESSVITDSILIGQNGTFIWKKRANNHLGLRYT